MFYHPFYQGCQMVYFQTKNPSFAMEYVSIFYGHVVYFIAKWYIYGHLEHFMVIWYIFSRFGMLTEKNLATLHFITFIIVCVSLIFLSMPLPLT
jgi:hypothetical protein